MERSAMRKDQMVRFVCSRCKRQLVWAEVSVTVKCPSCGRWIKANKFWQGNNESGKTKKTVFPPQQMELFS